MMYPQYYPQYNYNQQFNPQPQKQEKIWVQGIEGAKSYLVSAGSTVDLWDSESQTIYVKSADASGLPSIRIFDYQERDTAAPSNDIDVLKNRIAELENKVSKLGVQAHEPTTDDTAS